MANNTTLDSQMLIAAQQAYNITDNGYFNGTTMPDGYVVDELLPIEHRVNLGSGLKLVAFKNEANGERIIAFRGTDPTSLRDWYSDGQLGWSQWEIAKPWVEEYIRLVRIDEPDAVFHITGHSLGGGLAQYAAYDAITELNLAPSQLTLTTFNGFGVMDTLVRRGATTADAINATLGNLYAAHYTTDGDLVSLLAGGRVGDVTNGTLNTYLLGATTKYFLDAHDIANPDFQDLSLAQTYNFANVYLRLQSTQGVLAKIATRGDGDGQVYSLEAAVRVIAGVVYAVKDGDPDEIDKLGDWLADNMFFSGKITSEQHSLATLINWGAIGNYNPLSVGVAVALIKTVGVVQNSLSGFKRWVGTAYENFITDDIENARRTAELIEAHLSSPQLGSTIEQNISYWQDRGYDYLDVDAFSAQQAARVLANPTVLEAEAETDPFSFLPPLTAPDPTDYSDDPEGEAAYQTALDLYNQKLSERTQVETLYNQYITETNALGLLPRNSGAAGQTVINGGPGLSPDILTADLNTTDIYGLDGDDDLAGMAGVEGFVPDIRLHGGAGNDFLTAEYHHGGWSSSVSTAGRYTKLYEDIGPDAFAALYGRVKPGQGAFLYGEGDNDQLGGSLLDDTLDGGDGHDVLHGRFGDDTLTGGPGNDI